MPSLQDYPLPPMDLYLWVYDLNTHTHGVQKARLQLQVTPVCQDSEGNVTILNLILPDMELPFLFSHLLTQISPFSYQMQ